MDRRAATAASLLGDLTNTIVGDCLAGNSESWIRRVAQSTELIGQSAECIRQIGSAQVDLPADIHQGRLLADVRRRRDHFQSGGARGIGFLTPRIVKETRYITQECLVDGRNDDSAEQLGAIVAQLELDQYMQELEPLWPVLATRQLEPKRSVARAADLTGALRDLLGFFESGDVAGVIELVHPTDRKALSSQHARAMWINTIDAELAGRHAKGTRKKVNSINEAIHQWLTRTGSKGRETHPCVQVLIEGIEERDAYKWEAGWLELERVQADKNELTRYRALLARLDERCPGIAQILQNTEGDPEWSPRVREIKRAWDWAGTASWLRRTADRSEYESASKAIHRLQETILEATEQLASLRAWRYFFNRMDPKTRMHMIEWRRAVKQVGKGTGKYAYRHRRVARRHLMACIPHIPAWVMPLHKLWDTVGPRPGLFDTVIIDEASQAGVDSLLLLLLAKRIIVVGDDEQNSPEAVGVPEDAIASIAKTHLGEFEFREAFRHDTSLFDHAQRAFGSPITLREHFRCVPEIIRFSDDLCYRNAPLIPLRQAPLNRLEPLKHYFVAEGACDGRGARIYNRAEAETLAEAVISAVENGDYEGKTIGVIALQGRRQAEVIYDMIARRLPSSKIQGHRLRCGVPAMFQGDERDVIFLSLVVAPNHRFRALTRLADRRRFNVAMSRARDQVWLFHSVQQHDLNRDDFRYKLLRFFQSPRGGGELEAQADLERLEHQARTLPRQLATQPPPYESWFELDVALELLRRRYRVTPQVEVAGYRIDLVIEGTERRLAVECDGDAWHGAERFDADMARQRQLERAGWKFVRIRESAFRVDSKAAVKSITDSCGDLGIRPIDYEEPGLVSARTNRTPENDSANPPITRSPDVWKTERPTNDKSEAASKAERRPLLQQRDDGYGSQELRRVAASDPQPVTARPDETVHRSSHRYGRPEKPSTSADRQRHQRPALVDEPQSTTEAGEILTTEEVATTLGMNIQMVRKYAREGRLPAYRLPGGRKYKFFRREILDYLRQGQENKELQSDVAIDDDAILTTEEVATTLGMNVQMVRKYAREGRLPAHRLPGGRTYRFFQREVLDYLRHGGGGSGMDYGPEPGRDPVTEDQQAPTPPYQPHPESTGGLPGHGLSTRERRSRHKPPPLAQREVPGVEIAGPVRMPFTGYSNESSFPDPRSSHPSTVRPILRRIINDDGPLMRRSLYRLYIKGCPDTQRAGKIAKVELNKSLRKMISAGEVVEERELDGHGNGQLLHTVLHVTGSDRVRIRRNGNRDLLEIPPSELRTVARNMEAEDNEELQRQLLHFYGTKSLTKRRRKYLSQVLGLPLAK